MNSFSNKARLKTAAVFLFALGLFAAEAQAQGLRFPRPSQKASVMQTIGVTDITITYSRPGV